MSLRRKIASFENNPHAFVIVMTVAAAAEILSLSSIDCHLPKFEPPPPQEINSSCEAVLREGMKSVIQTKEVEGKVIVASSLEEVLQRLNDGKEVSYSLAAWASVNAEFGGDLKQAIKEAVERKVKSFTTVSAGAEYIKSEDVEREVTQVAKSCWSYGVEKINGLPIDPSTVPNDDSTHAKMADGRSVYNPAVPPKHRRVLPSLIESPLF
jgi:hypothetical protein